MNFIKESFADRKVYRTQGVHGVYRDYITDGYASAALHTIILPSAKEHR